MQSLIADYLYDNLATISQDEADELIGRFHENDFSDATFSQHVRVYVIDSTFTEDRAEVTKYLSDAFSSQMRMYRFATTIDFEASRHVLFLKDQPILADDDSIERILAIDDRKQNSHFLASHANELLWSATVHELTNMFVSPKKLVSKAQETYRRAARFNDSVYEILAQDTQSYADKLAKKKNIYFS